MHTMKKLAVSNGRFLALTLAILLVAALAQYVRNQKAAHDAWLAAAQAEAERGVPRVMSGPTVDELIENLQAQGIPVDPEMFQP